MRLPSDLGARHLFVSFTHCEMRGEKVSTPGAQRMFNTLGLPHLLVHIRNLSLNQLRKQNQRFLPTEVTGLTWNRRRHSFLGYA